MGVWEWMCEWMSLRCHSCAQPLIVEAVKKAMVVGKCWNMCWKHLQMFSVSIVVGEKASVVELSWGTSAKLPGRRPPPHWTGRAQVKERIMFSKLRILLFVCFRSIHGWMEMNVWLNDFTMPFLCADSGPWRKMSRAWPPMSAITTSSGSTCPSHQESAWGAAEARQERVIVEVVRKAIVAGQFLFICWTHLQIFSVSTVLGEKTSDVEQSWGASAKFSGGRLPPTLDRKRTTNRRRHVCELSVSLFVKLVVRMGGWEWMCEWMSLQCHSCAQTLDRGERCLGPDLHCPR